MTTETSETVETRLGPAIARTDRGAMSFTMLPEFDAPRERVFDAFASCEAISRWWGPTDWTLPHCEMDFRPGGTWLYAMRAPAGLIGPNGEDPWDAWGKIYYDEIERPTKLVYRDFFVDPNGIEIPGMPESNSTVSFVDLGGRTNLISTTRYASVEALEQVLAMGMAEGYAQTLERLDADLAASA